jgi:hypothetical protein
MQARKQGRSVVDFERIYQNLSINDSTDPHSLVNLAPSVIADRLRSVPEDMFELSEDDILRKGVISEKEERLRVTFWQEYIRAIRTEEKMSAQNIFMGVCTMNEFRKICDNSAKILYITMPIASFYTEAEYLLNIGFRRAKEVLMLNPVSPIVDKEGNLVSKIDYKLAALQANYFKYVVEITRPDEPKQIQLQAQHLHAHRNVDPIQAPQDMAAIEAKLALLESNQATPLNHQAPFQEVVHETVQIEEGSSDQ